MRIPDLRLYLVSQETKCSDSGFKIGEYGQERRRAPTYADFP